MSYTFHSRACADVLMLNAAAQHLLGIVGKDARADGILTLEQIPIAIQQLERAVAEDDALRECLREHAAHASAAISEPARQELARLEVVTLRQRAAPLLAMLRQSLQEGREITWSV